MKNNKSVLLFLIIILSSFLVVACNNNFFEASETNTENLSIQTANEFIELLFARNERVLDYSTGNVKKNIYNNFDNIKTNELIEVKSIIEMENDNFSIVCASVEYEDDNGLDIVFYRLKLINIDGDYLVYKTEEIGPIFDEEQSQNIDIDDTDMISVIYNYFNSINSNKLEEGTALLVGKAKKNHMLTYKYLTDVKELSDINLSDIKHDKLFSNEELALVKINYNINSKKNTNAIITLCKTHQGWLIYDAEQV